MSNPTVLKMVEEYLMKNHFDGLYNEELGCGCPLNNLNPCGDINIDCKAGFKVEASKTPYGNDYDYYICAERREKK